MPTNVAERPGKRTRLSPEREGELYATVVQLLREVGYEALTTQEVATRAKCSTATLWRQWQDKAGLVAAALRHEQSHPGPDLDADTGTLRGDLHEMVRRAVRVTPSEHELMAALAHAALKDRELDRAMRDQFAKPVHELLDRILDRAVARGEISTENPARRFCSSVIVAAGLIRPMLDGQPADEEHMVGFVDAVLLPALARPAPLQP
ncbi:TetR/AcrR family transcriptional regulator [Streptomyces sp. NPDC005374]|uniref:TetR/AcrR family transcriptional regulator n=1 Tax=Streptomyces sp. NPDC005374 TaxID=3364713 RepID=UPI0036B36D02